LTVIKDIRYFPKWQLPKGIFPGGNFKNVRFPNRQLSKSVQAAAPGPRCSPRRSRGPNLTFGKVVAWEIAKFEKLPLEKLSLGKMPLGKYHLIHL